MAERTTYLLVDGENIDATLGVSILDRRPEPQERPRWNTVLDFAESAWQQPVKGLFFLAVPHELPTSFVQALIAIGYRPVPLRGEGKVVDIAIQRTAEALVERDGDVMLVSHDADFAPQLERLAEHPHRRWASWASASSWRAACATCPAPSSSTSSTTSRRSRAGSRACASSRSTSSTRSSSSSRGRQSRRRRTLRS